MTVRIYVGDCIDHLQFMDDNSADSIVTDPPYGLGFMGKRWDYQVPSVEVWAECLRVLKPGGHLLAFAGTRTQHRMCVNIEDAGFEIRDMIAWVYSSGFPKSLNLDRFRGEMTCGCEGASESKAERDMRSVRDADVSQAVHDGEERWQVLQQGVPEQGASAGQVQRPAAAERACQQGMEGRRDDETPEGELQGRALRESAGMGAADGAQGRLHHGAPTGHGDAHWAPAGSDGSSGSLGPQPVEQCAGEPGSVSVERGSQARGGWPVCSGCGKPMVTKGLGTALKPALEPITVARKPLAGTVAENVLRHGTGGLNIDGCRVEPTGESRERVGEASQERRYTEAGGTNFAAKPGIRGGDPSGRWPANLIHDGSDEVLAGFPDSNGSGAARTLKRGQRDGEGWGMAAQPGELRDAGAGSAARFFYCAKASKRDREEGLEGAEAIHRPNGNKRTDQDYRVASGERKPSRESGARRNHHPTVKPTDLMRYLCRLVTPAGGVVLDPFMGSGSTGKAAVLEGFSFIGIDNQPEYVEIARARIDAALRSLDEL